MALDSLTSLTLDFECKNNKNGCKIKFIEFNVISEYYSVSPYHLSVKTGVTYFSGETARIELTFDDQQKRFIYHYTLGITTDVWDNHYKEFTSAMFEAGLRDGIIKRIQKG